MKAPFGVDELFEGFFILEGDTCTLYWFEGNEGFCVSGADKDLRYMLAIARSFEPAEQ